MQKINFENKPSTVSPINATNLNALQDNVENAINEISEKSEWITLSSDYQCFYRKVGKVVELNMIASSKSLEFGKNIVLGTLNEGFRPSKRIRSFVYNRSSSVATPRNVYIEIQPSGSVYMFNWDKTDTFEALSSIITYTID